VIYYSYKIGDAFVSLPLSEAQEMLSTSTEKIDEEVSQLEETLHDLRDEMKGLKAQLYARFGKSINLD
jgi:prefoldin subunit 4